MGNKINLGIIFGGKSVEHEISIISAQQVIEAVDKNKYNIIPFYISKNGQWHTGDSLFGIENFKDLELVVKNSQKVLLNFSNENSNKFFVQKSGLFGKPKNIPVDILFPVGHGTNFEDGTLQGLIEMLDIPYVTASVLSSAIGMDKLFMKYVFAMNDIPYISDFMQIKYENWYSEEQNAVIDLAEKKIKYPLIVKPVGLGSSVGITVAKDRETFVDAINLAFFYERRIIVEKAILNMYEINCAVMDTNEGIKVSVCEQPVKTDELLSYKDKYAGGGKQQAKGSGMGMKGLARIIPAKIDDKLAKNIQETAIKSYRALECRGSVRCDFIVEEQTGKFYLNEVNTIPGSISFYLWEATGIKFPQLIDLLIDKGFSAFSDKNKRNFSIETNVLQNASIGNKNSIK